ncbi:hypothetical protein EGH22_07525 [Halomicroarcula sp. F28]|uniref:hypothetical protein n=1 Tax=Haloarcula salinisoli TaxID=2487746 RepID=UPI001C731878|nr:hypothetical protein [Halomicroarcula salinisoli]MBX0286173.1 hypothetical protein [Halomicroarcula salinisoli]
MSDIDDLETIDEETPSMPAEARDLVEAIRDDTADTLQLAVRYSGEGYDIVYLRADIDEQFSDPELEEQVETLMLKGHGDPPQEGALFNFGSLNATMRFYDESLVVHFPTGEWTGLVFVLDQEAESLLDIVESHIL